MNNTKLNDDQMQTFIRDGYLVVNTVLSDDFHAEIFTKIEKLLETEGHPGNNILARIPELQQVFDDPIVDGALSSIIGDDYYTDPHRALHFNEPHSQAQSLHKDSFTRRRHHNRWLVAFYYPQDTPKEMGPTGVVPGSQYRNIIPEEASYKREIPLAGPAGRVAIANYDIVHRGLANITDKNRYMVKFLFNRIAEPTQPTWNYGENQWAAMNNPLDPLWAHLWDWHRGVTTEPSWPSMDDPIGAIRGDDETTAFAAAYSMSATDPSQAVALIETLTDGSAEAWIAAQGSLRRPPGYTAPSVNASYALAATGESAVESLVKVLETAHEPERNLAAQTLADMGLRAHEAVPALRQAVQDQSAAVRAQAVEGLGQVSQGMGEAIPTLIDALGDSDESVRRNATMAITQLSEQAGDTVPALTKVLDDTNRYVIGNAVEALYRIGTREAYAVLLKHLKTARWCPRTFSDSRY